MARQPDLGKQQRWLDLIRRWRQSQLSVRAFCGRHSLNEASFYLWRRLLRERGLLHDQPPAQRAGPAAFVKLAIATQPADPVGGLELVLSARRLVRVHPGFDAATLLRLVRLLEEPAC